MRKNAVFASFAFFCWLGHATVPLDCEVTLSGPTQTFIRLINEGVAPANGEPPVISQGNLRGMTVESMNPLADEVTNSANAAYKAAFSRLSKQIQTAEAHTILNHVAKVLGHREGTEILSRESQRRTAPILSPSTLWKLDLTETLDLSSAGAVHLHQSREGESLVVISSGSSIEILSFRNLDRPEFSRRSLSLGFSRQARLFSDSRRDLWVAAVGPSRESGSLTGADQIEVQNLTGRESFTVTTAGLSNKDFYWFEDQAGRKFLAALQTIPTKGGASQLEIFEVGEDLRSVLKIALRDGSAWQVHYSKQQDLYVTAVDQSHKLQTWGLSSHRKISEWQVYSDTSFRPFVTATGEVVVAVLNKLGTEEPIRFFRSGIAEPILSFEDFYKSYAGAWHEAEDGRLWFVTQIRLNGDWKAPALAIFEPYNLSAQENSQPKFARIRKFFGKTPSKPYSEVRPIGIYPSSKLSGEQSGFVQNREGNWTFLANSDDEISLYRFDGNGSFDTKLSIALDSEEIGFVSPTNLKWVQDPVSREWMTFRHKDSLLTIIPLTSSTVGSHRVRIDNVSLSYLSNLMGSDSGQTYLSNIEVQRENSRLGYRLFLNLHRITGRVP